MTARQRVTGRGRRARLPLVAAAIALLPAVVGCSTSASTDETSHIYPTRSLADALRGSPDAAPPPQMAGPTAPGPAGARPGQPGLAAAPGSASVAAAAPASPAPPADSGTPSRYPNQTLFDAVAAMPANPDSSSRYPTMTIFEALSAPPKPAPH